MTALEIWADGELISELEVLDKTFATEGVRMTEWEMSFIDTLSAWEGELTSRQRFSAISIIRKYEEYRV